MPDSIHSDQGRNFESQLFQETCMLLEINKTRSTACHPEGNGQIENLHRTMKNMLTARAEGKQGHWNKPLDFCMMAYWSSVHSLTGPTPFELVFGCEMPLPLDVVPTMPTRANQLTPRLLLIFMRSRYRPTTKM